MVFSKEDTAFIKKNLHLLNLMDLEKYSTKFSGKNWF